ncbi:hypothetical protein [Stakelama tenebrarum]|uniref:Uncharacterized protein n=1 Tax=Stakelama tenebrarum TaxID=2711215 RepID=A0A6G6Y6A5_9SPHN|nr:hypothetical protein [Sphingosinithalassobacter tenebrarum]QIG80327.1 hypothetical protein G5C33_11425 [Sphingosinithalassobacter tenebrarum]
MSSLETFISDRTNGEMTLIFIALGILVFALGIGFGGALQHVIELLSAA